MWFNLSPSLLSSVNRLPLATFLAALLACAQFSHAQPYPGIGRDATSAEIKAWDIDVRADFKGLPKGSGGTAQGNQIWDGKCASCHGVFGESNAMFPPLTGGTTPQDMATGRAAGLINGTAPYRTTLMKTSQLSTLWDYINRAMPWNAPKSLSTDEVYAVTAYLLNLGGIVADGFVLSDQNIASVQAVLPNRNGKTSAHGLWHVKGKPDVRNTACLVRCGEGQVSASLPDYVRNVHGNLAEQNRSFGPFRGIDTTQPPASEPIASVKPAADASLKALETTVPSPVKAPGMDVKVILNKHSCTACHGMTNAVLGPAFAQIAKKHLGNAESVDYLTAKIKQGSAGVWGAVPMPAQPLPAAHAAAVAQWLVNGMK